MIADSFLSQNRTGTTAEIRCWPQRAGIDSTADIGTLGCEYTLANEGGKKLSGKFERTMSTSMAKNMDVLQFRMRIKYAEPASIRKLSVRVSSLSEPVTLSILERNSTAKSLKPHADTFSAN